MNSTEKVIIATRPLCTYGGVCHYKCNITPHECHLGNRYNLDKVHCKYQKEREVFKV